MRLRDIRSVAARLSDAPLAVSTGGLLLETFLVAEAHGVAGILWDAVRSSAGEVDADLSHRGALSAVARELDYEAHLNALHAIDACLVRPTVALKGALFASRYYARPSARGTSDIDILVDERDLDVTVKALAGVGFVVIDSADEIAWSRREHHHLHLARPGYPDLELHFHAHRGFGVTLRSEALLERSVPALGFRALRVPSPADEFVFLAVHAASHRFGRLSWLYDLRLMVDRLAEPTLAEAAKRARQVGLSRVLAFAGELLVSVFDVAPARVRPLGTLSSARRALLYQTLFEPRQRVLSSATRFAYTMMLTDAAEASLRYATTSSLAHARRLLGSER